VLVVLALAVLLLAEVNSTASSACPRTKACTT
jgi:hypothetical protein